MTREETIEEVKNYENYPNGLSKECRDYIIKVLEQEPILDKIRAEIEEYRDSMRWNNESLVKWEAINYVLEHIVDKYKTESEKT